MHAITESRFGSISRLAEHLGVHYRNVESYVIGERGPVDRYGYVKYDVVALCEALGQDIEALFPEELAGQSYKFDDGNHPGKYGPRPKKKDVPKDFPERTVSPEQAREVVALLDIRALVKADQTQPLAEALIRRLKPDDYDVFRRMVFEGLGADDTAKALGISPRAARSRYKNALRLLNSPGAMRVLKDI